MAIEIPLDERRYKDCLIDVRTWQLPKSSKWSGWYSATQQVGNRVEVRSKWTNCCDGHKDESEAAYHALDVAKQKLDLG